MNEVSDRRIIWVIGFPKSGNTWLSYLVSYIANLPYHDFADLALQPKKETVRQLVSGRLSHEKINNFNYVYKSHKTLKILPVKEQDFVLYIYRDPRDLYISYRHFMKNKFSGWKGRLVWKLHAILGTDHLIKWLFNRQHKHIQHWKSRADHSLSYRELQQNSEQQLAKIFDKIEHVDERLIQAGIQAFNFESLSEGRAKGKEDKSSFYRKGIVDEWEKALSAREKAAYESLNIDPYI